MSINHYPLPTQIDYGTAFDITILISAAVKMFSTFLCGIMKMF